MKYQAHYLFVWLSLFLFHSTQAQIIKPYQLSTSAEQTGKDTYRLIITGILEPGWHLYSQHNDPGGSNPLVIKWEGAGKDYETLGEAKEYGTEKAYNDIFNVTETLWSHKIKLTQDIKLKNPSLKQVKAHLEGQVCKEACILMSEDLIFDLSKAQKAKTPAAESTGKTQSSNSKEKQSFHPQNFRERRIKTLNTHLRNHRTGTQNPGNTITETFREN